MLTALTDCSPLGFASFGMCTASSEQAVNDCPAFDHLGMTRTSQGCVLACAVAGRHFTGPVMLASLACYWRRCKLFLEGCKQSGSNLL